MRSLTPAARTIQPHVQRLWKEGKTIKEMAPIVGKSRFTVGLALQHMGLSRPAARRPGVGKGSGNSNWKGGEWQRHDGYWMVCTPAGTRFKHRVVMEQHIGRPLRDDEVVHHRDENKSNNEISNLEIMTPNQHARHHAAMRAAKRKEAACA